MARRGLRLGARPLPPRGAAKRLRRLRRHHDGVPEHALRDGVHLWAACSAEQHPVALLRQHGREVLQVFLVTVREQQVGFDD